MPLSLRHPLKQPWLLLGSLSFLAACQLYTPALAPPVNRPAPQRLLALSAEQIARYYPMEAGRSWTFALEQTQNDQDNTKFKTMTMLTEPLPTEGGAEQAILRRRYPDSDVLPNPTLIRRFPDRVELSRYQETVRAAFAPQLEALEAEAPRFVTAMKLPFEPGQRWQGRIFNGGTEFIYVVGEETVTVPAGTFQALKIEHHKQYANGKEDFLRYWYAPDVGMVKLYEELTFYYGQWLKFRSTGMLTDYHPKK